MDGEKYQIQPMKAIEETSMKEVHLIYCEGFSRDQYKHHTINIVN